MTYSEVNGNGRVSHFTVAAVCS